MFITERAVRVTDEGTTQEVWVFDFDQSTAALVLREWLFQSRDTKRHKWRTLRQFNRFVNRGIGFVPAKDVFIPDDVAEQVTRQLCERITVVKERTW